MSRFYGLPIRVKRKPDGKPHSFLWHGQQYRIVEVYGTWHLMDRWWERGNPYAAKGPSDRCYYRVECQPRLQCGIYFDSAQNVWVMDRVLDELLTTVAYPARVTSSVTACGAPCLTRRRVILMEARSPWMFRHAMRHRVCPRAQPGVGVRGGRQRRMSASYIRPYSLHLPLPSSRR
jgi:hypothetical protein